ncbi:MAG: DNA ligase D [Betaproteobacteria bacterium]
MGLSQYHAKRDFRKTPEPRGRVVRAKAPSLGYLIQKHAASHLHYDFRLELNGVLLSWAVPKGPSLDPADKRLAMHVEDHPLEYGQFEGTIPKGQYGGGTVMLWDRGTWAPVGDPKASMRKGHLKFDLEGEKLQGRWALIRTHSSKYGSKAEAWLLVKDNDAHARRGMDARIVDAEPDSVASGRSIEAIAAGDSNVWHSNRSAAENVRRGAVKKAASSARAGGPKAAKQAQRQTRLAATVEVPSGARRAALPAMIAPALCSLVADPPKGVDWLHEVKYDGYRLVCRLAGGKARIFSRNAKEWTARFPALAQAVAGLDAQSAWIDGEMCAVDEVARSRFQALQNALSGNDTSHLVFFAFDLPYLDGYDLRDVPLVERKKRLADLIGRSRTTIRYSPEVAGAGAEMFVQACRLNLEGIVSKRANSRYGSGLRTRNWVKVKCIQRQEMVIGGYTDPQGSRAGFGALLLGVHDESGDLRYAGKVGTGFDDTTLERIRARLDKLASNTPPFVNSPRGYQARGAHWVKPTLVAEIKFTEWSASGALRHPSFAGLREDKKASDVVREKPVASPASAPAAKAQKAAAGAGKKSVHSAGKDSIAGVKLSHPDKLLFPEANLSKLSLARYYESVADWILPHVESRPLSLYRCPYGWGAQCFYQKHADKSVHASVRRVEVPEGKGTATYFSAGSLQALVALVQWGVIELHPWGSRMPNPAKPDRLVFDFDPAVDVPWDALVEAARMLQTLLEKIELPAFLKTTGGKGLHVVVPIKRTVTWTQAKAFTKAIADMMARTFPDRFIASMSKSKRQGKIFVDYLRNAEGATAIAAYGIRARKNAPVSTPIEWGELAKDVRFDHFNVVTVPRRLARQRKDPWEGLEAASRPLTAAMFGHVGATR